MGIKDVIYPKLPVSIQNILISVYGYYWHKKRFGGVFKVELKKYKERELYTETEWESLQQI